MKHATNENELFGKEWTTAAMKLPKEKLVLLLRKACWQRLQIAEDIEPHLQAISTRIKAPL